MLARRLARQGAPGGQLAQTLLGPRCPGCSCAAAVSVTQQQRRAFARRPPDGGAPSIRDEALREDLLGEVPRPPWWPKLNKRPAGSGPAPSQTPRTARAASSTKSGGASSSKSSPDEEHTERVAKRLARVGLCSRREADEWISAGRVSIDGVPTTLGSLATPGCKLLVDGKLVPKAPPPQLFLYHKPKGVIVTRRDAKDKNRRTIADELSDLGLPETLKPVGRLDYQTSGLMLLTNDGTLASGLERSNLPRTYLVKAYGGLHKQKLTALQRHGRLRLPAKEGFGGGVTFEGVKIRELAVEEVRRRRKAHTKELSGSGASRWYEVTLIEGKNREVVTTQATPTIMVELSFWG